LEVSFTLNVGISSLGVIRSVVEKSKEVDFRELSERIEKVAFKIARVGELIGREIARELNVKFGIVERSLAPTPFAGESIAE